MAPLEGFLFSPFSFASIRVLSLVHSLLRELVLVWSLFLVFRFLVALGWFNLSPRAHSTYIVGSDASVSVTHEKGTCEEEKREKVAYTFLEQYS